MEFPEIFSATLGLSPPWEVTDISYSTTEKRMDITISFTTVESIQCPLCGSFKSMCHAVDEVWYHNNFFCHTTYLHTQVPYIQCCELIPVERPWSRAGSRFSLIADHATQ